MSQDDNIITPEKSGGVFDFKKFLPFWLFLAFFKFAGGLHYTILSPFGEKLFPLWLVGFLIGFSAFLQLLFDIPAGYILDRYGYKRVLKITTLLFIAASACLLLGLSRTAFLLSLFISVFGWLFFGPGTNAYVINQSSKAFIGRFISSRDVFASIGIVLASILVPFAVVLDIKVIGIILLVIFAVAYLFIAFSPKEKSINTSGILHPLEHNRYRLEKNFLVKAYREIMRLRPPSIIFLSVSLSASTFYGIVWFVVPLLIAHEMHGGLFNFSLGIFDLSIVLTGFLLGRIVDLFNKRILIFFGLIIFSIAGIFLGFNFNFLFLLLGFLATCGDELSGLSLWAWIYKIDKKNENYGLISGALGLFDDLGWMIGPILAGVLYGIIGPTWTIAVGGLIIFFNLIIFLFISQKSIQEKALVSIPPKPYTKRHKQ